MLITTTDQIAGHEITESLGLVRGSSVRARAFGRDIIASLRTIVGGEVREYSELLSQTRQQAIDRMTAQAAEQGADAIVALRFVTSDVSQGTSEILAYGTAVKTKVAAKTAKKKEDA